MHIFDELKSSGFKASNDGWEAFAQSTGRRPVSWCTGYDPNRWQPFNFLSLAAIFDERRQLVSATNLMRSLAVRLVSLVIRPSKMLLNVASKQRNCTRTGLLHSRSPVSFLDLKMGHKAEMVNNYDLSVVNSFIDSSWCVGKYLLINAMMSKESVKNLIETEDFYTEFAYQIMQGDFYVLNQEHNVILKSAWILTNGDLALSWCVVADKLVMLWLCLWSQMQLVRKFGKSEGNAVWPSM